MNVREEWQLDTRRLGRRVLVYDRVDSTSTRAAELADDRAHDGVVVLAGAQTIGRGQYGRTWQCPDRAGVLMSVLLFPPPPLRRAPVLAAWAAVSVCEVIRKACGHEARIKWPNDVLLGGRKVCGILIEQGRGTVAGIGLNLNQSATFFAEAGLPLATSLAAVTGRSWDVDAVARQLIVELDDQFDRLAQGDWATLEARWKGRLGLLGKAVAAECLKETVRGRLRDLTFSGVELEVTEGKTICLSPEAVLHLDAMDA